MPKILEIKINFLNKTKFRLAKLKIKKIIFDLLKEKKIIGNFEIGIKLVSQKQIKKLNNQYRQINLPTDVLSFPTLTEIDLEQNFPINNLGDIVICPDYAKKNVQSDNRKKWQFLNKKIKIQKINQEIFFLVQHGLLHLIGIHHKES